MAQGMSSSRNRASLSSSWAWATVQGRASSFPSIAGTEHHDHEHDHEQQHKGEHHYIHDHEQQRGAVHHHYHEHDTQHRASPLVSRAQATAQGSMIGWRAFLHCTVCLIIRGFCTSTVFTQRQTHRQTRQTQKTDRHKQETEDNKSPRHKRTHKVNSINNTKRCTKQKCTNRSGAWKVMCAIRSVHQNSRTC